MDDTTLAVAATRIGNEWVLRKPEAHSKDDPLLTANTGSSVFDVTGMGYERFKDLPHEYIYALLRAMRPAGGISADRTPRKQKTPWEAMSKTFSEVIDAIHRLNRTLCFPL
ncbi:hypothetical protein IAT40_002960 [Kwoniella sp. CBS 6097]